MNRTCVAIDLETTGLDPERDEIIEVAAVRFRGAEVLDNFQSLARPRRRLPYRIQLLTGIHPAELQSAPAFPVLAPELAEFVGADPLVGHNVSFDLAFLEAARLPLTNPRYDTLELAEFVLPTLTDYSLGSVAKALGIPYGRGHRAEHDARVAMLVFQGLLDSLLRWDSRLLAEAARLAASVDWPLGEVLRDAAAEKVRVALSRPSAGAASVEELLAAPERQDAPVAHRPGAELPADRMAQALEPGGALSQMLAEYEHRPQQVQMMQAVTRALNDGHHLLVEAGTGTGKSMAYLLPCGLFAWQQGERVVISTNTINLQEQLVGKDVPDLRRVLASGLGLAGEELRVASLKGRGNYLCLRRLAALRRSPAPALDEVRLLLRLLAWLPKTQSGDRAELSLSPSESRLWTRVAADSESCLGGQCVYQRRGTCFVHRARQMAASAHLVIVNHALLLADLAAESQVIPEHSRLVIDEAHHLEDEATDQFGFRTSERDLVDRLGRISQEIAPGREVGLLADLPAALRATGASPAIGRRAEQHCAAARRALAACRDHARGFFALLRSFLASYGAEEGGYGRRLSISRASRAQPAWSEVEIAWENVSLSLLAVEEALERLRQMVSGLNLSEEHEVLPQDLAQALQEMQQLRERTAAIVSNPEPESICWLSDSPAADEVTLASVPLHVGPLLSKLLFSQRDTCLLTGATLTTEGSFRYIRERLGLDEAEELALGTSFDYERSTLVVVPSDMPEPSAPDYHRALSETLFDITQAAEGRTLALFTSHASLGDAHRALRQRLEQEQILVLGQGIDGSPKQLLAAFKANPRSLLLGAASFWEGVDVMGENLSLLVVARLPFSVPTDPVFAERSQLVDDPFNQYALPQAVLRFKQGFGRLIRSRNDRGVFMVLDQRIRSRPYGAAFLRSLPRCTVRVMPRREAPDAIRGWLAGSNGRAQRSA